MEILDDVIKDAFEAVDIDLEEKKFMFGWYFYFKGYTVWVDDFEVPLAPEQLKALADAGYVKTAMEHGEDSIQGNIDVYYQDDDLPVDIFDYVWHPDKYYQELYGLPEITIPFTQSQYALINRTLEDRLHEEMIPDPWDL